ncbi:MAG: VCBS repeat-containing protein [Planctomycetes bacterium]|nr:VCBS repeat-containing protein [Planctomycetota bacterium]
MDETRTSPAEVTLVLTDAESRKLDLEIVCWRDGESETTPLLLEGSPASLRGLASSAGGTAHTRQWDYAAQFGDASFRDGIRLEARAARPRASGAAGPLALGNDPPALEVRLPVADPAAEGITGSPTIAIRVADSSEDVTSVRVRYAIGAEGADWKVARPVGLEEPPGPDYAAFRNIRAARDGTALFFSWDAREDLGQRDETVRLQIAADDGVAQSEMVTPPFRIDNNREPIVIVDYGSLAASSDTRRGIPIPFTLFDEEGDRARIVCQWRLESEAGFPELPEAADDLEAILASPDLRREHRIGTEAPPAVEGRVVVAPGWSRARLPELGGRAATLLASGIEGRELEILRPSSIPAPLGGSRDIASPVDIILTDRATSALVLDRPRSGSWRLREVDLATALATGETAAGTDGDPVAMCRMPGGAILVVVERGEIWSILAVDRDEETIAELYVSTPGADPSPPRDIVTLSRTTALITAGDSLRRLVIPQDGDPPRVVRVTDHLSTPWGMVLDPLRPEHVYVAERDAYDPINAQTGRVVRIDINTTARTVIPARPDGLPRPRALALERWGTRLLALTDEGDDGILELRSAELGGGAAGESFVIGRGYRAPAGAIASGADGLRAVALSASSDLAVGGGVEQVREILAYDPAAREVEVAEDFAPPLAPGLRWRIRDRVQFRGAPRGTAAVFVWDSEDLDAGGRVYFRVTPYDDNRGVAGETYVAKDVAPPIVWEEAMKLGVASTGGGGYDSGTIADIDGDGDLDVVAVGGNSNCVAIFHQRNPRRVGLQVDPSVPTNPEPDILLCPPESFVDPYFVCSADVDGDGRLDLLTTTWTSWTIGLFFQDAAGAFPDEPSVLLRHASIASPRWLEAADLDGDGDLDIASAGGESGALAVFFQEDNRTFGPAPEFCLGGSATTGYPRAVLSGDVDLDGDLDLMSSNRYSPMGLTIFLQSAAGRFGQGSGLPDLTLATPWQPNGLDVADLDGDGQLDLMAANLEVHSVSAYVQRPSPVTFSPPVHLGVTSFKELKRHVLAGDLDRDGDLDIVSTSPEPQNENLAVFLQTEPGQFGRPGDVRPPHLRVGDASSSYHNNWFHLDDLDGDGCLDILCPSYSDHTLSVFFQQCAASFCDAGQVLPAPPGAAASWLSSGDVDGDGDLDLLAVYSGGSVGVARQLAAGLFSPISLLPNLVGSPVSCPVALLAEIDGDGILDLALARLQADDVAIYFGTGNGEFAGEPLLLGSPEATNSPVDVQAGDVDGDGDIDLAVASSSSDCIAVFLQESPRRFGIGGDPARPHVVLEDPEVNDSPRSLALADLDADGDLDILAANRISDTLSVYSQTAPGEFAASPLRLGGPAATNYPWQIIAEDIDGDGDLDIVSVNSFSDNVALFLQDALGRFGVDGLPGLTLGGPGVTGRPRMVAAADFDRDGDLDLVTQDMGTGHLVIFLQALPGRFEPEPLRVEPLEETFRPSWVEAADLDGDSEADLAALGVDGSIEVLFNSH